MARQIEIDWTVTIEESNVLLIENDVRVYASVCDDGEVIIDDLALIKYGATVKLESGALHRPIVALLPFTDSDKPWLAALGEAAAETLLDDERFIREAHEEIEARATDYADAKGDYLYEMARGA